MIQVTVRNSEPLEKALRRFKKKFEKAGILKDLKKNAHYMKPSTERRMKQAKARKRHARDARQQRR